MNTFTGGRTTSIYIVDENYKICYFNKTLQRVFPELKCGDICYKTLCCEEEPCKHCPLTAKKSDSVIFYNKPLQRWIEVSTGKIDWPGERNCNILLCREIHEGNKNLLYNLAHVSAYDELFELNLTQNTYKILFHLEGKYVIPEREGLLREMVEDVSNHMIHPEDKEAFLKFWNLDNILPRLMEDETGQILTGEFRKKVVEGGFRWVLQKVVPVRQGVSDDRILMCFIQDIHEQKIKQLEWNQEKMPASAARDRLTGLLRRGIFLGEVESFLKQVQNREYCLVAIDIEHFKIYNEWYGQEAGDQFLIGIGEILQLEAEDAGIAGYMGADDFCILLPNNRERIGDFHRKIQEYVKRDKRNAGFSPAFGVYEITDKDMSISTMYDRASIALASVKGNYACRISWYDTEMIERMEKRHVILSQVQKGLEQEEFVFYAQPQCNMATGKIIGLESLVRWNHPEKGLIQPGEFVPLLEETGFISNLDLYIWEMVCRNLKRWTDRGHRPIPISINVSRVDIYTIDVVETFTGLVEKYGLDSQLIEIEITESTYAEDYQVIKDVVEKLRGAGFTVLMDDFGSGYSSLNMLKDVNVDILKIDMKFLEMNEKSAGKGLGILETITSMARLMGLRMIAEGVETREQVDLLLEMGCIYGQGYYFYQPMSAEVLEELLADEENIDFRGIRTKRLEHLRIKELMNGDMFSETVMNNILGGIAFYSVSEKEVELLRANEQYYKIVGTNPIDVEEQRDKILDYILEEDVELVREIFKKADKNPLSGSKGCVRRVKGDGTVIWMQMHVFYLKEQDGRKLYYASIADVTEQKKQEQKLELSQKALSAVIGVAGSDESFMKLAEENRRTAETIFAQMSPAGMIGGYCEEDFPLYFANSELVEFLGYDSYEEFAKAINYKVINTIHPDDRAQVAMDIGPEYYAGLEYTTTYQMPRKDGTWFWTMDKGKVICAEDGRLAIVSVCLDISEIMEAQKELARNNIILKNKNLKNREDIKVLERDALTGFFNRQAALPRIRQYLCSMDNVETGALIMFDLDNFKLANDVFGHTYGDSMITENAKRLKSFFRDGDIVCRFGGDEFLVVCRNIKEEDLNKKLEIVLEKMITVLEYEERTMTFTISAGYAMIPEQGECFEELYRKADVALFAAKMEERSSYRKYDDSMREIRCEMADRV